MIERVIHVLRGSDDRIESYDSIARRVIEAMREPTEEMKDAYYKFDERFSSYPAQDCWKRMLDEALK